MKYRENAVIGLDIGSSKICAIQCLINEDNQLDILGIGSSVTAGIERGKITDGLELERAIERAMLRAQQAANCMAGKVVINIPLSGFQFIHTTGITATSDVSGQITLTDQQTAITNAKSSVSFPNKKIMHVIPLSYRVNNADVQNPIGVFGAHLEVLTHIITADTTNLLCISKLMKRFGLQIMGIVYDPLALAHVLIPDQAREQGVILLDIGGRFSKWSIFKNNRLQETTIIPIGGETITNDIAYCLKVRIPEAERLKIIYGNANLSRIDPDQTIEINSEEEGRKTIKLLLLCQIITARLTELCRLIQTKMQFSPPAPYPIVLSGQSAKQNGLREFISEQFASPTSLDFPDTIPKALRHISQASAYGLLVYGLKNKAIQHKSFPRKTIGTQFLDWFGKNLA